MPVQPPKDTISAVNLPDDPGKEAPAVYAVKDLRDYIKPPLDDSIASPVNAKESLSTSPCSCNSVCACVPVGACGCDDFCACDSVAPRQSIAPGLSVNDLREACYCEGDEGCSCQGDTCPCQCTCQNVYYYPKCLQPVEGTEEAAE
jgi:hypothetical protein